MCLFLILSLVSCKKEEKFIPRGHAPTHIRENHTLPFAEQVPADASEKVLLENLKAIIPEIKKSCRGDIPQVRAAIKLLREQPVIIDALIKIYQSLPKKAYQDRSILLGIIGEMKRDDAFPFLREVIWNPLPEYQIWTDGTSPYEEEEMIAVKAVQCLAYLNNAHCRQELMEIMLSHQSSHVKIMAVDAFMWNQGDSEEAAAALYQTLPPQMHKYVEMPRFAHNMDADQFREKLERWTSRWGQAEGDN